MCESKKAELKPDMTMFYKKLKQKVQEYQEAIQNVGFAKMEYAALKYPPQNEEELLEMVCRIIDTSKELNFIMEQNPSSVYVADTEGKTLRINRNFEELTGLDRKDLLGKETIEIEKNNIFAPSVCSIALREGRRIVALQTIKGAQGEKEYFTAGVPIFDENGELFRVMTNALSIEEMINMTAYWKQTKEKNPLPGFADTLIAESRQMKDILELVDLVKDTESTIIIEGETGVGKSMMARYIHDNSNRRDKRMTEINCGAIPAQLLESELFGYASGAFTGASKKGKEGLIEASEGGTILLDEISELPLLLQVKLLHFLQNKRITRIGDTEEIPVDVRVIAATNKPLETLVEKGEFRSDLYYRLNVVSIVMPPLRERKEDIMPAVYHFVEKYTKLYQKHLQIQQSCIDHLLSKPWKGNLRELENYVERLVVTEGKLSEINKEAEGPVIIEEKVPDEPQTMDDMERKMILEAYHKYGSSYKVAKALGISQSTAYRKIRKYTSPDSE